MCGYSFLYLLKFKKLFFAYNIFAVWKFQNFMYFNLSVFNDFQIVCYYW